MTSDPKQEAARRAEAIRDWLDQYRGRREAFSHDEATCVAAALNREIKNLINEYPRRINRKRVAMTAFSTNNQEAARRKLRDYAHDVARDNDTPSAGGRYVPRKPDDYVRVVRALNRLRQLHEHDGALFIKVFQGTRADPAAGTSGGADTYGRRLESLAQEMADRIAARLRIEQYYRQVALYGATRDLDRPGIHFELDTVHPNPTADFVEAALPIMDAAWFGPGASGIPSPRVFIGRLPSAVLYRLRAAGPEPIEVRLRGRCQTDNGPLDTIETRQGRVFYYFVISIGLAPRDEHGRNSTLLLESAPTMVIKLAPYDCPSNMASDNAEEELVPADRSGPLLTGLVEGEYLFHRNGHILRGELVDPTTGRVPHEIDSRMEHALRNVKWGPDRELLVYEPVTAESWWHYLVKLPAEAEEHGGERSEVIEYCSARPPNDGPSLLAFSVPGTPSEAMERELYAHGNWRNGIEEALISQGERLRSAMLELRQRSVSMHEQDKNVADDIISNYLTDTLGEPLQLGVRAWRERLGLNQREAARLLGMHMRTLSDYERGKRTLPHTMRLAMLFCLLWTEEAHALVSHGAAGMPDNAR